MYIHIGNDIVIKKEKIIAIFNLEKINKNSKYNNFIEKIIEKDKIIKICKNGEKSMILIEENNEIKAYISNISSITLSKREMI